MRYLAPILALALSGCASSYQLTLMPRDSGKTYGGVMDSLAGGEGRIAVTIEGRTYNGTWVESAPAYTTGWAGGAGYGYRRWGGYGAVGTISMDNPNGGLAKALLTSSDGAGLRCDFQGTRSSGGGVCRDDMGKEYDVQIRLAAAPK
ncbi:MAG: hypothetical protein ACJ8B6_01110 [Gemmatimonadales bacterium]